ncbi:MAG: hypothetical protein WCO13_09855 [Bacteroidota bacterium]
MNKKIKLLLASFLIISGVTIYSCSKDETVLSKNVDKPKILKFDFSQFGKKETIYDPKVNPIKDEDSLPKESPEIGVDPGTLIKVILTVEDSVPKIIKSTGDCGYVGVFKMGNCHNSITGTDYQEVSIYFDSEDHNNQNRKDGQTGSSSAYNNIEMHFCLVPSDLFGSTGEDYAVLRWEPIACGTEFEGSCRLSMVRFLDCEDKGNNTKVYENNQELVNLDNDQYHLTHADAMGNVRMEFVYFTKNCNQSNFPDLGMEYGVLGTFSGIANGHIYSDDEDDQNINYHNYPKVKK